MSTSDLNFSDISPAAIDQAEEYLRTMLVEEYPSLDAGEGRVIRTHVINIAAILHAVNRQDFDNLRRSFSPLEITADPDLADPDIVDAVYANYHVTRELGNKATGQIAIIISDLVTTAVPNTAVFTSNGLNFVLTQTYIGVTTADAVISSTERLIEERADGSYVFTVPVVAAAVGEQYRMKRNARFTAVPAIAGATDLQAAADFEGGLAAETNAELVARTQQGIAPQVFSGRAQVAAMFQEEVTALVDISQVGLGDPEMLRDRDNIFQSSHGGKADLYVQTQDVPDEIKVVKECTYVGSQEWQFTLFRDDAPGFYLVTPVVVKDTVNFSGSLEIVSEQRAYDLTLETDWVQAITDVQQAAYTRYQTAIVKFKDPTTPTTTVVGAKVEYDVYVLRMPDIKTLNDLTVDRSKRPEAGDYLVKAAIPALTAVSLQIHQRAGTADPDVDAVKQAVASRVNSLGFSIGRLPIALIIDAAQGALELGGTAVITPVDMYAFIYPPDTVPNGRIMVRNVNELVIPNLPARGVSQRTTVFYLPEASISIAVVPMPSLSI